MKASPCRAALGVVTRRVVDAADHGRSLSQSRIEARMTVCRSPCRSRRAVRPCYRVFCGGPADLGARSSELGNGVLDLATSQVAAVAPGGLRLIAAQVVGPGARTPATRAVNTDPFHDRDELRGIAPLTRRDQQRQRAASAFTGQAHLAGQATPGASESLVLAVVLAGACFFSRPLRRPLARSCPTNRPPTTAGAARRRSTTDRNAQADPAREPPVSCRYKNPVDDPAVTDSTTPMPPGLGQIRLQSGPLLIRSVRFSAKRIGWSRSGCRGGQDGLGRRP